MSRGNVTSIVPVNTTEQLGTVAAWGGRALLAGADPGRGVAVAEDARFVVGGVPDGLAVVFGVALPDGYGPFPVEAEFRHHPRHGKTLVAITIRFDEQEEAS